MTALTVPDVLRRAEQVIGQRGWCQDDFEDAHGRVCAQGAIRVAIVGAWVESEAIADEVWRLEAEVIEVVEDHLCGRSLSNWNDEDDRMAIEVRAALLAAAQRAEAGT